MPWIVPAAIVGGSTLVGSYLGGQAAQRGAETQAAAMRESAALQKQMFDVQNAQQAPYREAGYSALNEISGMKPYLTQQFGPEQFQANLDPSYAFRLQQGNLATQNLANQSGGLIGGNALQGLINYGQGAASQEYQNAFNRFQTGRNNIYNIQAGIAGLGQASLGNTNELSSNAARGIGGAISGAGSAIGAGQVAAGNALNSGIQGAGNAYTLSQFLSPRSNPYANAGMANQQFGAGNVYGFGGGGVTPTGVTNFELG